MNRQHLKCNKLTRYLKDLCCRATVEPVFFQSEYSQPVVGLRLRHHHACNTHFSLGLGHQFLFSCFKDLDVLAVEKREREIKRGEEKEKRGKES